MPETVNSRREPAAAQSGVIEFVETGQVWVLYAEPGHVGQLVKAGGYRLAPVDRKPDPGPVLLAQITNDVSGAAFLGSRVPVLDGDGDIRPVNNGTASVDVGVLSGVTWRHESHIGRLAEKVSNSGRECLRPKSVM